MSARKRILLVDDDYSARRLAERIIRNKMQCEIIHAEDGSEALKLMLKNQPDLVVLDIIMPFMNGIQVLKTMKSNARLATIPIIACTAVGDNATVKQIIGLGITNYIVKPIDKETFINKISSILEEPVK